jgi:hypothetical protein
MGKPEGKRALGKRRRRWMDNFEMDLEEIGSWYYRLDWCDSRKGPAGRAFRKLCVPKTVGKLSGSCPVCCCLWRVRSMKSVNHTRRCRSLVCVAPNFRHCQVFELLLPNCLKQIHFFCLEYAYRRTRSRLRPYCACFTPSCHWMASLWQVSIACRQRYAVCVAMDTALDTYVPLIRAQSSRAVVFSLWYAYPRWHAKTYYGIAWPLNQLWPCTQEHSSQK